MNRNLALLALGCTALGAWPCFAAETRPCADDKRIECIDYKPNDVIHLIAAPGQTLRIQLGAGEKMRGLHVSDERTLANDPIEAKQPGQMPASSDGRSPTCDPNICRNVVDNFVYIMPRRELVDQPFFLQTDWCDGAGKCQPVPYAFDLEAKEPGAKSSQVASVGDAPVERTPQPYYGVRILYPAREAAERKREKEAAAAVWRAAHPATLRAARAGMTPPEPAANWQYLYQGSATRSGVSP